MYSARRDTGQACGHASLERRTHADADVEDQDHDAGHDSALDHRLVPRLVRRGGKHRWRRACFLLCGGGVDRLNVRGDIALLLDQRRERGRLCLRIINRLRDPIPQSYQQLTTITRPSSRRNRHRARLAELAPAYEMAREARTDVDAWVLARCGIRLRLATLDEFARRGAQLKADTEAEARSRDARAVAAGFNR